MPAEEKFNFQTFKHWLELKTKDFDHQGYSTITSSDIWSYFTDYKWKKGHPSHYHQVVHQINQLTVNEYFNYEQLKAQVYDVKSIEDMDLNELI